MNITSKVKHKYSNAIMDSVVASSGVDKFEKLCQYFSRYAALFCTSYAKYFVIARYKSG